MRPLFLHYKQRLQTKALCALVLLQSVVAFTLYAEQAPSHPLANITQRQQLTELLSDSCEQHLPQHAGLFIMFTPPPMLWEDQVYRCDDEKLFDFNQRRPPISLPKGLFSADDQAWLLEAYRLIQQGTYSFMGEWIHPQKPQDISFLHRAFAKHPYITARLMAAAPAPHVGEEWSKLYQHLDRILLASPDREDQRLLAFAMARDGREQQALNVIQTLLEQGDSKSLHLLPLITLDTPQPSEDEMADTTEPEMGYQVLAMLENYLYQQHYPREFCDWANTLAPSPLADYVATLLVNMQEHLTCPARQ